MLFSTKTVLPVKAVYLIDSLNSGGAQRQFVELVKKIDHSLIEPTVVLYYDLQHYRDELDRAEVRTVLLPKKGRVGVNFLWNFSRLLLKTRPALIHSFLRTPNFYARAAKALGLVKRIITSERNVSISQYRLHLLAEKWTWRLSDRIIANAEGVKSILVDEVGVATERISVVRNGIDVAAFSTPNPDKVRQIRESVWGDDEPGFTIGLVGRICRQKGHLFLAEACEEVRRRHPDLRFRVCFWGEEIEPGYVRDLKEKISAAKMEDLFLFCRVEKDMASVLATCDLVVLPSLWEGFPNALLEAMAAGRPVLATKIVDNHLIIEDGETGFLAAAGDSGALAERLSCIFRMTDKERKKMGARARAYILETYSIEKMVSETLAVYRELGVLPNGNEPGRDACSDPLAGRQ